MYKFKLTPLHVTFLGVAAYLTTHYQNTHYIAFMIFLVALSIQLPEFVNFLSVNWTKQEDASSEASSAREPSTPQRSVLLSQDSHIPESYVFPVNITVFLSQIFLSLITLLQNSFFLSLHENSLFLKISTS